MSNESLFHPVMKVINGVVWQTEGSTPLARQDDVLFGKKMAERYLCRTAKGAFFEVIYNAGVGKGQKLRSDEIKPLTREEALKRYEKFTYKLVPPGDAFPGTQEA